MPIGTFHHWKEPLIGLRKPCRDCLWKTKGETRLRWWHRPSLFGIRGRWSGGFSPYQHALGQAPDLDGKFFDSEIQGLPVGLMDSPEGEFRRQSELRLKAEEIFIRWQASERLSRALNSKGRPVPTYNPGDLVFYWRTIKPGGQGQKHQTGSYGGYAGPARVLAMEVRYDEAGNPRHSSVIWLVRNNRILKATVQQLRLASKRETVVHELSGGSEEQWDVGKLVAPLANHV